MHFLQGRLQEIGSLLAQDVVDLGAHFGQGRSHLVRCVRDESLTAGEQAVDPRSVLVDRLDERPHFRLNAREFDRAEVGLGPSPKAVAHDRERSQAAGQAEPHEAARDDDESALPEHSLDQDLPRQCVPRLPGLGDDDDDR